MGSLMLIQSQLLATKLYVPMSPGTLIRRPRLHALLNESLKFPLTLVSAPAGFGKTTFLSTWAQSLPATQAQVAWLSLDEEENNPQLFWTYVLSALSQQQPERFTSLVKSLQSSVTPLLMSVLTALIERMQESTEHLVLILDDYHVITEQQVHAILWYLMERLPPYFHLILATRVDPPLPLSLLRERRQVLEIRTEQLRCTTQETQAFLQQVMALHLPDQTIQEVTARTEGWLVGLKLLALSQPEHVDPLTLLQQISGEQHYILDYLTEVVLHQQPAEVQHFLLCTCILERLSASLCDAVMEQTGSQQVLEYLEQSNLFVVSLDHKREWYRYHALFAQALHSQLEQSSADLVPTLHARASHWYAQHQQTTQAILHAFEAEEWQWAADLIEGACHSLVSFTWGANKYALVQLRQWVEQLPIAILTCRPHLCLACAHLLYTITPDALLYTWLDLAEAELRRALKALKALKELKEQMPVEVSQGNLSSQGEQEQRDLLGKVLALRTLIQSYTEDGPGSLALGEQALALLSPESVDFRAIIARAQSIAYYSSSVNDAMAASRRGYQAAQLSEETRGQPAVTLCMIAATALCLIGEGHLDEAEQLIQQASQLETPSSGPRLPEVGWIMFCQAEILRERNQLAVARSLATEAISLCEQSVALTSLSFLHRGYAILIRVCLSCGELDAACSAFQQTEQLRGYLNGHVYQFNHSLFTTIDQVRLWLARGELDRATRWAKALDVREQHLTPFARERQEVALARVLLAQDQPRAALQRLESARQRATAGRRWGHVIEMLLLQALAHQKLHEEPQALVALSEAVHLAEPEGYIRSFVEEGAPMADLLRRLREEQRKDQPTPYLDTLLATFAKERKAPKRLPKQSRSRRFP
jgi:LuxR family maltose regulon positive regulatory protein